MPFPAAAACSPQLHAPIPRNRHRTAHAPGHASAIPCPFPLAHHKPNRPQRPLAHPPTNRQAAWFTPPSSPRLPLYSKATRHTRPRDLTPRSGTRHRPTRRATQRVVRMTRSPLHKRNNSELNAMLASSERAGTCLAATTERTNDLLIRRMRSSGLVSPFPKLYARAAIWKNLTKTQRARHVLLGVHALHPEWAFCGVSAAVLWGAAGSLRRARRGCSRARSPLCPRAQ